MATTPIEKSPALGTLDSLSVPPFSSGPSRSAPFPDRDEQLVERIALWMDRRYLDPILGFVLPGVGDVIGAGLGLLAILSAFRLRAHPVVIARMFINLAIDSVLGSIPLVGAVFDFFYRAHTRNLNLLRERDLRGLQAARPSDWLVVGGAALAFLLALCLPIVLLITAIAWFW